MSVKMNDSQSNLYYFDTRYYDPALYRFLSPDPVIPTDRAIYNPQRWNLYGYCLGNPINKLDNNGTDPVNILVVRIWEFTSQNIVVGCLFINGQWGGYTMERNRLGKIPDGTYDAVVTMSQRGTFGLKIVNYYDEIKISLGPLFPFEIMIPGFYWFHRGWSPEHSDGCFLVGWDYDFDRMRLRYSTAAFSNLLGSCIEAQGGYAAALAYSGTSLEDVFYAWLMLDAISAIVRARISIMSAYIGDAPRYPVPADPLSFVPSYFA